MNGRDGVGIARASRLRGQRRALGSLVDVLLLTAAAAAACTQERRGMPDEVRLLSDTLHPRFEPAELAIERGGTVTFVLVAGGPANVAFYPESLPPDARRRLSANMPNQIMELAGPLLLEPRAAYTVSFEGVEPGRYPFYSVPHAAAGMRGAITVR